MTVSPHLGCIISRIGTRTCPPLQSRDRENVWTTHLGKRPFSCELGMRRVCLLRPVNASSNPTLKTRTPAWPSRRTGYSVWNSVTHPTCESSLGMSSVPRTVYSLLIHSCRMTWMAAFYLLAPTPAAPPWCLPSQSFV